MVRVATTSRGGSMLVVMMLETKLEVMPMMGIMAMRERARQRRKNLDRGAAP